MPQPSASPRPAQPALAGDAVAEHVGQWAAERPDLDASPLLVIGRISRLNALLDDVLRPTFAAVDLTSGDFDVLAALRRSGAPYRLGSSLLASRMLVTNGAVTKRVDRLEAQGLVARAVSPVDGRGRDICLTQQGLTVVDQLIAEHLANERAILSALEVSDLARLAELLGTFLQAVEQRHALGAGPVPGGPARS